MNPVRSSGEHIEHRLHTGGSYLKYRSEAPRTRTRGSARGCAIQISVRISNQTIEGKIPVSRSRETVEHRFRATRSYLKYGAESESPPLQGCAIEIACLIPNQRANWPLTV